MSHYCERLCPSAPAGSSAVPHQRYRIAAAHAPLRFHTSQPENAHTDSEAGHWGLHPVEADSASGYNTLRDEPR